MKNPLAPYFDRVPTDAELAAVSTDELKRIVDAARDAARMNVDDLRETKAWARSIRTVAERALASRNGK